MNNVGDIMAIMYPKVLVEESILSTAEIFIYKKFKEKLNDNWIIIHSMNWISDGHIGQSQGECDFLIINKEYGVIVLEVKGGKISASNGTWYSINSNNEKNEIKDPEKEANNSKFILLNRFRKEKIRSYITCALCFPDTDISKAFLPTSISKEIILDINSFEDIEANLIRIFKYRMKLESFSPYRIIESDFNKILKITMPNVKGEEVLGSKIQNINMKFLKLNEEQDLCFSQLEDNNIISINGHAGTGKTVLAMNKAFKDSKNGKKVLYICYNELLKEKITKESNNEFDVFNIYGFAEYYLKKYDKNSYEKFQEDADYDEMISTFLKIVKHNKDIKYDTVLVDEGQDFRKEWIEAVKCLINENSTLCIFYDEAQMLYEKFGLDDISYLKIGVKYKLKRNMRNTDEICLSSLKCIGLNRNDVILSGVKGDKPQVVYMESNIQFEDKIKELITKFNNDKISEDNITFLIMEAKKKIYYKNKIKKYTKSTVESVRKFKGLENDIIIIPDLKSNFLTDKTIKKLLYVAMSRARCKVIVMIDLDDLSRKQIADFKKKVNEVMDGE